MVAPRRRQEHGAESGFSIVEVVVAIGIVGVILMTLTAGLASGLKGALTTKVQQTATGLGDEAVERARALPYTHLNMLDTDLAGDTRIQSGEFDPDGSEGELQSEPVAKTSATCPPPTPTQPCAAVYPHVETKTIGETPFTLSRYVTWVDANFQGGPAQDHKRITAIVTWPVDGQTFTYRVSTLVANVVKGQNVEKFTLTSPATKDAHPVSQGSTEADVPAAVENLDLPETYDLAFDDLPPGWDVTFYDDAGSTPGEQDPGDQPLFNSAGSADPDTGELATAETFDLLAVLGIPADAAPGDYTLPLRATAASDPSASKVISLRITIT